MFVQSAHGSTNKRELVLKYFAKKTTTVNLFAINFNKNPTGMKTAWNNQRTKSETISIAFVRKANLNMQRHANGC